MIYTGPLGAERWGSPPIRRANGRDRSRESQAWVHDTAGPPWNRQDATSRRLRSAGRSPLDLPGPGGCTNSSSSVSSDTSFHREDDVDHILPHALTGLGVPVQLMSVPSKAKVGERHIHHISAMMATRHRFLFLERVLLHFFLHLVTKMTFPTRRVLMSRNTSSQNFSQNSVQSMISPFKRRRRTSSRPQTKEYSKSTRT